MDWLSVPADEAAPRLLGMTLTTRLAGDLTSLEITEVEAYLPDDPASHSYRGRTSRNESMFGRAGGVYVYRSYGIHWCVNIVTGPEGSGQAVLIRAGRPIDGIEVMTHRRGRSHHLMDGPGKLCQAMAIDGTFDGTRLGDRLDLRGTPGTREWRTMPRVGITAAADVPLRFVASGGNG